MADQPPINPNDPSGAQEAMKKVMYDLKQQGQSSKSSGFVGWIKDNAVVGASVVGVVIYFSKITYHGWIEPEFDRANAHSAALQEWENKVNDPNSTLWSDKLLEAIQKVAEARSKQYGTTVKQEEGRLYERIAPKSKQCSTRDLIRHVIREAPDFIVNQLKLDPAFQRALLRDALGPTPEGKVAHHIIPLEAIKEQAALLQKAAQGGFDINGANNGIHLTRTEHIGGHPVYNQAMLDRLRLIPRNLSPAETAREVQKVTDIMRQAIQNGTYGPWG
jgi:hypothetical protein